MNCFMLERVKGIFKIVTFVVTFFLPCITYADQVTLSWEKPDDSRVIGYYIYCGLSGTDFTSIPVQTIISADQTSCVIFNLEEGQTYNFIATSFDAQDNESDFSETINCLVPVTSRDNNGDGYTECDGDLNDNDAAIYPGAIEICGDGIDQDCNGIDLLCLENTDTDGDLMDDNWEIENFGNTTVRDGFDDWDRDGYSDYWEYANGSDPLDGTTESGGNGYDETTDDRAGTSESWSLDIDGNGEVSALTDGILVIRYLLGFPSGGATWIDGAVASGATRSSADHVEEYVQAGMDFLDIDGNGEVCALTDGILIIRYLLGFPSDGSLWIDGAVASGAPRISAKDIEMYMMTLMP